MVLLTLLYNFRSHCALNQCPMQLILFGNLFCFTLTATAMYFAEHKHTENNHLTMTIPSAATPHEKVRECCLLLSES